MGVDYSNPANSPPDLHAWYRETIKTFPPLILIDKRIWTSGELELVHEHQADDQPGRVGRHVNDATVRHGAVFVESVEEALA